jgi:hypothetical protein
MARVCFWKQLGERNVFDISGQYLGKAHLTRMVQNYADAGTSAYDLKERASEMLVGDPFMKL